MDKKLIAFLIVFLMVSLISSQDYKKVVEDSSNKTIIIKDCSGIWNGFQCLLGVDIIGTTDVAKLELKTPHINYVIKGKDRLVAEFEIDLYQDDFKDAITKLEFYDLNKGSTKFIRDYKYKYKTIYQVNVDDYKTTCTEKIDSKNGSTYNDCIDSVTGTHKEDRFYWNDLNSLDLVKGKTTIGIFTDVYPRDYVEFVPTIMNNEISEWATWTSSFNNKLISYYNFSEVSGTTINDSIRNKNIIDATNGRQNQSGLIGYGYTPINNIGNTTISLGQLGGSSYTINFWVKAINSVSNGKIMVSSALDTAAFANGDIEFQYSPGNVVNPYFKCSGLAVFPTVNTEVGSWKMFSMVINDTSRNGNVSLYLNGTLYSTKTCTGLIYNTAPITLFTAPDYDMFASFYINQITFDETGIWNRSLSDSEINDLYNNGTGITYDPLLSEPQISYNPSTNVSGYYNTNQVLINFTITNITSANYSLNGNNYTFSNNDSQNYWSIINLTLDYNNSVIGRAYYTNNVNETSQRWYYYLGNGTIEVNITSLPNTGSIATPFNLNYTIKCLTHSCRDSNYTIISTPVGCTLVSGTETNLSLGNLSINQQISLTNVYSCVAASSYNFTIIGGSKYSSSSFSDSINIASSSSGGAYTCDVRSSAVRNDYDTISFVIAVLGSNGLPEDHELTSECYDSDEPIESSELSPLNIINIGTGRYKAVYENTGNGFCYIHDTDETCGFNKAIWNKGYIDNSTINIPTSQPLTGMVCREVTLFGYNDLENKRLVCTVN